MAKTYLVKYPVDYKGMRIYEGAIVRKRPQTDKERRRNVVTAEVILNADGAKNGHWQEFTKPLGIPVSREYRCAVFEVEPGCLIPSNAEDSTPRPFCVVRAEN